MKLFSETGCSVDKAGWQVGECNLLASTTKRDLILRKTTYRRITLYRQAVRSDQLKIDALLGIHRDPAVRRLVQRARAVRLGGASVRRERNGEGNVVSERLGFTDNGVTQSPSSILWLSRCESFLAAKFREKLFQKKSICMSMWSSGLELQVRQPWRATESFWMGKHHDWSSMTEVQSLNPRLLGRTKKACKKIIKKQ